MPPMRKTLLFATTMLVLLVVLVLDAAAFPVVGGVGKIPPSAAAGLTLRAAGSHAGTASLKVLQPQGTRPPCGPCAVVEAPQHFG